jgi:hypothetical protein
MLFIELQSNHALATATDPTIRTGVSHTCADYWPIAQLRESTATNYVHPNGMERQMSDKPAKNTMEEKVKENNEQVASGLPSYCR